MDIFSKLSMEQSIMTTFESTPNYQCHFWHSEYSCFMGNILPEEWIFEVQCIARLKSWLVNDCHNVNIITLPIQNTGLICFYFFKKFCGKHISTCCCGDNKYLLLAMSWTLPDNVCPILAKSGVWRRHRTWYQWVSGWLGAVESHMVILWKTFGRTFRIQNKSKMWFTISTAIGYLKCLSGKWKRWEITGIPKAQDILGKKTGLHMYNINGQGWSTPWQYNNVLTLIWLRFLSCVPSYSFIYFNNVYLDPTKATSNQKAMPWISPVWDSLKTKGMSNLHCENKI